MKDIVYTINDRLQDALQSDLENGVAWLNEQASLEFASKYPELLKAIQYVSSIVESDADIL